MDADDIRRVVTRVAGEIVEKAGGTQGLILVGLDLRGMYLARRIAGKIKETEGADVPVGQVSPGRYGGWPNPVEFLPMLHPEDGAAVVLVQDVLFHGRSVAAAIDSLLGYGSGKGAMRPRKISLVALVDRGHRELPIRADHVGRNVPTDIDQLIRVHLIETDGEDGVDIGHVEALPVPTVG